MSPPRGGRISWSSLVMVGAAAYGLVRFLSSKSVWLLLLQAFDAERDGVHAERELHGGECRRPAVAPSAHELAAVTPLMECCPFLPPLRVRSLERAVLWRPLPRRRGERHHSARRAAHDLELEAVHRRRLARCN